MEWTLDVGFLFLFLTIVIIWSILRKRRQRHHKDEHRIRPNNGYSDSSSVYPGILSDDSFGRHDKNHDHKHHEVDSSLGSHHHTSDNSISIDSSSGDSSSGDSGGGGD